MLRAKQPRARRYPFLASVVLTDLESGIQRQDQTIDLSSFGCRIGTQTDLFLGTRVRLQILFKGAKFTALGNVAYRSANGGVGVRFTEVTPKDRSLLDDWLSELRSSPHST